MTHAESLKAASKRAAKMLALPASTPRFWVGWSAPRDAARDLYTPWRIIGWDSMTGSGTGDTIYAAAVIARTEHEAQQAIRDSYESCSPTFRFCERHEADWDPFTAEWSRQPWMNWP